MEIDIKKFFFAIPSIVKRSTAVMLCALVIGLSLSVVSCEKNSKENNNLAQNVYYVVGYDGSSQIDTLKGTAKSGGYLFISEDLKDSLLTNNRFKAEGKTIFDNLLDDIVDIPIEAMISNGCGFTFFPEEYRFAFKVRINSYRPMTEEERLETVRVIFAMCYDGLWSSNLKFKPIVIKSILKIE